MAGIGNTLDDAEDYDTPVILDGELVFPQGPSIPVAGNKEGAVVILSGGLDSTTCLAVAHAAGYWPLTTLSFFYGQRHRRELQSAEAVAGRFNAKHVVIPLPLDKWGGSALTDPAIRIPKDRGLKDMAAEVPITYVPGRNLIFLALAASLAEAYGCTNIFFGATQVDYSGYPDCRREFLQAVTEVLDVGTKVAVEGEEEHVWHIHTPLLMLGKKAIISLGLSVGAPYDLTWSCYEGRAEPCGECDSCKLRAAGFAELGVVDPSLAHWRFEHDQNTQEVTGG